MTLSLIVCTLGRTAPLRRLFASLRFSAVRPLEIVVVDQNRDGYLDGVLGEAADLPLARVGTEPGLSRARNVGLVVARGALVAFPDDDCWYPHDLLGRVAARFAAEPGLGVLTGRTADATGTTSLSPHLGEAAPIDRGNVFLAGNSNGLFVRADLARAVGGFDEDLGVGSDSPYQSGEETDFLLRCLAAGAAGRFDPSIVVHHDQKAADTAHQVRRARAYAAGFGRVLRKNGFGWPAVAAPVARTTGRALVCAATFDFKGAARRRAWAAGALRGFAAAP